jgi:hypothetical protein
MCCSPRFLLELWEDRDRQEPADPEEEAAAEALEVEAREEEDSSPFCC